MVTTSYRESNKRFLRAYFPVIIVYVALCFIGPYLLKTQQDPSTWLRALVAILTAVPIAAVFWLLGRYLHQTDEFTRKIQAESMLIASGVTLSAATVWGFLELYQAVPRHEIFAPMIMVGPLFFLCWLVTYPIQAAKNK